MPDLSCSLGYNAAMFTALSSDLFQALQRVRRSPGLSLFHVGLLAAVVGVLLVAFNVYDVFFLRPAAVRHPERLYRLTYEVPNVGIRSALSRLALEAMADQPQVDGTTGFLEMFGLTLKDTVGVVPVRAEAVQANYFSLLGVRMATGRGLLPEEAQRSAEIPLVLSDRFWRQHFAGDLGVVGRRVSIRNQPARIVGVTERAFNGFSLDSGADLRFPSWAATLLFPSPDERFHPDTIALDNLIVLHPDADLRAAQDALIAAAFAGEEAAELREPGSTFADVQAQRRTGFVLESAAVGQSWFRDRNRQALNAFLAAAGLLFLLVAANLAGLWLARAVRRETEMSVRLALGAGRSRLVREFLAEALLLGTASAVLAVVFVQLAAPLLPSVLPPMREFGSSAVRPIAADFSATPQVLAVGVAACFLATLILALAPAVAVWRLRPMDALKRLRSAHGWKGQRVFLVAQVALSTALVVGALLSAYTLRTLSTMDLGFDYNSVAVFDVRPEAAGYTGSQTHRLSQDLRARVELLPGVRGVAFGSGLLEGIGMVSTFYPTGTTIVRTERMNTSVLTVSPDFFRVLGQRVLQGREFAASDERLRNPRPILVNETYAERFLAGKDPVGQTLGSANVGKPAGDEWQVVGVVADAQMRTLRHTRPPIVYNLAGHHPPEAGAPDPGYVLKLYVSTAGDPTAVFEPVRGIVKELAPEVPVTSSTTLREQREISLRTDQLVAGLGAGFTALAFLVAGLGIFSLLSLMVAARTKELGVRMAVGAQAVDICRLVLRQVLWIAVAGMALGIAVAMLWFPSADDLFRGVTGRDPWVLLTGAALVLAMALLAALVPVSRAVRLQPVSALRED